MSLFNTIRTSIYGTVILFTIICLAMAGHFQSVLAASDLTRFVPFAIFVCSATLLIMLCLLAFTYFFRERNPITTKFELIFLGMVGLLWLILGVYLATSDAQSADVECFAPENLETPLDNELADFHTDQYHAMYRVLMTFSLMNAVIIIFTVMFMLALACFFRRGDTDKHMWQGPITSYPWFSSYKSAKQSGAKAGKSSVLPVASKHMDETIYTEKPERKASSRRDRNHTSTRPYPSRNPYPTPPKPTSPGKYTRQGSGSSPRAGLATVADLEHGGMLNPYSNPGRPRGSPRY